MSDHPPRPIHPLNYVPGKRSRKWLRRVVWLISAATLIGLGMKFGPALWRRQVELYWQRQCMNFQPPDAGAVVMQLLQPGDVMPPTPRGYVPLSNWSPGTIMPGPPDPNTFSVERDAVFAPPCWGIFASTVDLFDNRSPLDAIVFLHGRRSPSGLTRLVVVGSVVYIDEHDSSRRLVAMSIVPGDADQPAGLDYGPVEGPDGEPHVLSGFMVHRVFAGIADPIDGSKFTIGFEWPDDVRGIIDGQLLDAGHVRMTIRPGPGDYDSYVKRRQTRSATQPAK